MSRSRCLPWCVRSKGSFHNVLFQSVAKAYDQSLCCIQVLKNGYHGLIHLQSLSGAGLLGTERGDTIINAFGCVRYIILQPSHHKKPSSYLLFPSAQSSALPFLLLCPFSDCLRLTPALSCPGLDVDAPCVGKSLYTGQCTGVYKEIIESTLKATKSRNLSWGLATWTFCIMKSCTYRT
jgi:hypothetical protein